MPTKGNRGLKIRLDPADRATVDALAAALDTTSTELARHVLLGWAGVDDWELPPSPQWSGHIAPELPAP